MAENTENGAENHDGSPCADESDGIQLSTTAEIKAKEIKLDYYFKNSIKYVFRCLKNQDDETVTKSKLQVVCANLCRVWGLPFTPEYLNDFNKNVSLSFDEFIKFVEENLLNGDLTKNCIPIFKLDDICWLIYIKEQPNKDGRLFSDSDSLLLWKVFKKIDIEGSLVIDREEVAIAIEQFLIAIGTPWTPVPMDNYSKATDWSFWDFLDCLEKHYIKSFPKSVYKEGIDALVSKYVNEVLKSGCLIKQGHRVKSMKQRWFVLVPNKLSYFVSKEMTDRMKGEILINKETSVESIRDTKTIQCRFSVFCGERQVKYLIDAPDQRTKNEWITSIQSCIDAVDGSPPLIRQLTSRKESRNQRRALMLEEEQRRLEQEALIKQQLEQLEQLKLEREKVEAEKIEETAMLEEERKRRAELEEVKLEYERLLAEEKIAREAEEEVRLLQEKILDHERQKRLELEEIKNLQENILREEREKREGLEEESKEQARILEEERQRMKELQDARERVEGALNDAHKKLEEAEEERRKAADAVEAAKERTRCMKLPVGLARPLQGGQGGIITHRGLGAFTEQDFSKVPRYMTTEETPKAVNATTIEDTERAVIESPNLVKPSQKRSEES